MPSLAPQPIDNVADLAGTIGISRQVVLWWKRNGVWPPDVPKDGPWTQEHVAAFRAHREKYAPVPKRPVEVDARTKIFEERSRILELKRLELESELLSREVVTAMQTAHVMQVRLALQAAVARIRLALTGDRANDGELVEREIRGVCERLAESKEATT